MATWTCAICNKEFKADENHNGNCLNCGAESEYVFPKINARRVHGDRYQPYKGNSRWAQMANSSLKAIANDNFNNR